MERTIDARELDEWMAFFSIEPFGPMAEDLRAANLMCLLANIHKKSHVSAFRPGKFTLCKYSKRKKKHAPSFDIEALAHALAAASGVKVVREK